MIRLPVRKRDEDLFAESTMSFGDHLEELRKCLIRALIGMAVGFGFGLYVGDWIVQFIQDPLEKALRDYYVTSAIEEVQARLLELKDRGERVPDFDQVEELLREDGLVPTPFYVDPREAMSSLVSLYPEQFGPMRLPNLSPGDFIDFGGFCRLLVDASGQSAPSPARRLWDLLDPAHQALVRKAAAGETLGEDQMRDAVKGMDLVLSRIDFYRPEDFTQFQSEVEEVLTQKPHLTAGQFHRRLLGAAYADEELLTRGERLQNMIPMFMWLHIEDDPRTKLKSLSAHEPFMIYMKASLIFGAVAASPWILFQIWSFVASGLYWHERKYVYIFMPISLCLFLLGASVAFFFVFQPVLQFLLYFNRTMGIDPDIRISEWLGFALLLPLGFGVAFQLPLVMLFLERIGILSVQMYLKNWRIAVLVIFVISAILTPADPYSILLLAVPLCLLYYFGILMCQLMPRLRRPEADEES
jgi:sec-independent protein translocase protein TatC